MKNLLLSITALFATSISFAQVGIGVTNPHASAALEVKANSNDKGVLIPRLTRAQRDAITSPAVSLMIYQTDNTPGFYYYSGSAWLAVGDNLGNHTLSQALNLNGEAVTDNTASTSELTIQSLIDEKDVHIKSYDEIFITTISGSGGTDPAGTPYSTYGDIELTSAGGIILKANEEVLIESDSGEDVDIIASDDLTLEALGDDVIILADDDLTLEALGDDVIIDADDDIKLDAGNDGSGSIVVYDPIESTDGMNIILDSDNDIELKVTSGDFVEIWENGVFLYTLPGSRGSVGQFLQRSSDGTSEYFSDWSNYALPTSDGTNGQVLTTDGSGDVSWSTPSSGGASSLNDLSDVLKYNTTSLTIGHSNTGTLNNLSIRNTAIGHNAFNSVTSGSENTAMGSEALFKNTAGKYNTAVGTQALYNAEADNNVAVGRRALYNNSSGDYNVALGTSALAAITEGRDNTALGFEAGYNLKGSTSVSFNNASGYNVLIGTNAAREAETTTNNNVFIGSNVARYITQVSKSVFLGDHAGEGNFNSPFAIGERNIYLGAYNNASAADVNGEIVIGADATGNGSNTITLGHTTNTDVYARGTVRSNGTALTSDRRLKADIKSVSNGLSTVMKLNPVAYKKRLSFDTNDYNRNEIGFIAQEIQEILPELVSEGPDKNKTLSLDYNSFIPILAKAIQEQQAVIDSLLKRIETLEAKN